MDDAHRQHGAWLRLQVAPDAEGLRRVRSAIDELAGSRMEILETARLLTSELVTNSIRHAGLRPGDAIRVVAGWTGTTLRVMVRDGRSGARAAAGVAGAIRPSPTGESGWGLFLVDRLATRWGTNLGGVPGFWFELEADERHDRRV